MIVVSDTTPLRHLIAIGKVDLLRRVYGAVVVPVAVWSELQAQSTPSAVKAWLQSAPDWLQVRRAREPLPGDTSLDNLRGSLSLTQSSRTCSTRQELTSIFLEAWRLSSHSV